MSNETRTKQSSLAIHGGQPCVVEKPASYLHGPQAFGEEEIQAVTDAIRSGNLFRFFKPEEDSPTAQFEKLLGEKTQAGHVLAVNSGTSALICGLVGLGVSSGDEVIVPAYTYIASAAAVLTARAIPVIAEVDASLTLDPADVERKITPRTRAILPVHMRGVPCRMDALMDIAARHDLKVLEDVAQANGASFAGRPCGSIGDAGAFSLQHFKIVTAGEGGAMTTNDRTVFERGACYHDSAYTFWKEKDWSIEPFLGEDYRMSELAGALALVQMKKRDGILARLRQIKRTMWEGIADLDGLEFQDIPDRDGDCGLSLVFYVTDADLAGRYADTLRAEGMAAGSMFDKAFPDRHIYYHWDYVMNKRTPDVYGYPWNDPSRPCRVEYTREMCPRTLDLLGRSVVLPLTQVMSDAHVDSCIRAIRKVHGHV